MKQNIIVGIIIIVAVAAFALFNFLTQAKPVEYFTVKSRLTSQNALIEDYKTFSKLVKDCGLTSEMTNSISFEREGILDYFNEEFFATKKIAMVVVYEDDSKGYIYSIDEVIYNEAKTEATIKYTYKNDGYAGPLSSAWYNYLFTPIEGTVEKVNFVLENNKEE